MGWYADGHGYCFVCETPYKGQEERDNPSHMEDTHPTGPKPPITPITDVFRAIPRRGLSEASIAKFKIDINLDKERDVAHRYPYFVGGIHVANKVRKRTSKDFYWEGNAKDVELFGQHLFPPGCAKSLTIVEGELDAPSAWQLMGSRYPCVSVASAGSAIKDCKRNYEYLDSFEEIVICFDKDAAKERPDGTKFFPGQEAARKVAELFAPGKCRILELQHGKDPNEYLQRDIDAKIFVGEWWKAKRFTPDGLVMGPDLFDGIFNRPNHFQVPYPFEGLTRMTYGIRTSEFVVLNAPTGVGKTSLIKAIEYNLLMNPDVVEKGYGIGFLHLEETYSDLGLGLLSCHIGKPLHLPDCPKDPDEMRKAFDAVLNTPRVVVYDHFGSNSIDAILAKVRHMAALGCKYVVLDHLSIVVSDQQGDERKQLDEISTKLKTLCMELDIAVIAIIHQNRNGQIRGTAGVEQLANIIMRLERDLTSPDEWRRNVTKITVDKNRFCGRTGPACWLFYNEVTGCLEELGQEDVSRYEEGGSAHDDTGAW